MWTRFMDMHSGGGAKEKFEYLYIEATETEAEVIFYNRFTHSPNRVSCTCCGEDYSISRERDGLEEASAFERGCKYDSETDRYLEETEGKSWREYIPLQDWLTRDDVAVIYAADIKEEERCGSIPSQGYVWVE